ncbi:MAG: hypothetical protein GC137_08790 [Alphaproteobacteria bacterium]|nr:hypothetical protein [Alphaproteobacteria bacterium]
MVYLMLDAAELEIQENADRDDQVPSSKPADASKQGLHHRLQGRLNMGADQDTQMQLMLLILEEDENPDDDLYNGKHGKLNVTDQSVGSLDLFKEGTANDSPENINGVLELAIIAKQTFGDKEVHLSATECKPEQMAMAEYAAQLAGLNNVAEASDFELSEEIRQKMDTAWAKMQQDLGLTPAEPSVAPEMQPEPSMDTDTPEYARPSVPRMGM